LQAVLCSLRCTANFFTACLQQRLRLSNSLPARPRAASRGPGEGCQRRLASAQVRAAIVEEPHALDALLAFGWEAAGSGGAGEAPEALVAPRRPFTMADVRLVEEAKDALKKAQRAALTATARPADPPPRPALHSPRIPARACVERRTARAVD
jgi:hypothetical protein